MNRHPVSLEILQLQRDLIARIKFHQRQLLMQLPRDLALQAMNEAYDAARSGHSFPEN